VRSAARQTDDGAAADAEWSTRGAVARGADSARPLAAGLRWRLLAPAAVPGDDLLGLERWRPGTRSTLSRGVTWCSRLQLSQRYRILARRPNSVTDAPQRSQLSDAPDPAHAASLFTPVAAPHGAAMQRNAYTATHPM